MGCRYGKTSRKRWVLRHASIKNKLIKVRAEKAQPRSALTSAAIAAPTPAAPAASAAAAAASSAAAATTAAPPAAAPGASSSASSLLGGSGVVSAAAAAASHAKPIARQIDEFLPGFAYQADTRGSDKAGPAAAGAPGKGGKAAGRGYGHSQADGKGKGKGWEGPTIVRKAYKDLTFEEGDAPDVGFELEYIKNQSPTVTKVDENSSAAASSLQVGDKLLRIAGLDTAILSEEQVKELLEQRPAMLRFVAS
mmetsp:Transcript_95827/g.200298  ORF Transcript_95827/g.200298 Transcript_95827/m.200298 type:complete len:251 (+) Transcript_95827:40-792(+)|eukprot:CAMPEP_0206475066 /NCGR_PEP_ID=MMETSP0324_2-20121206/33859_1 /ASSEMBLY_ACC=CAM_ASM_000836 /TAXON_ID=2866 /ORGANISM="Crypthecodinium cohnii, Strain Seligo" /LENGTH=250 /DNA_ID=CAMNT_0053950355 /DNA_START=25 /DNA_END=777 /DNA_ORIENTATION=+